MSERKNTILNENELISVIGSSTIHRLGPDGGNGGREGRLIAFADTYRRHL